MKLRLPISLAAALVAVAFVLSNEKARAISISASVNPPSPPFEASQETENGGATGRIIRTADSGDNTHWVSGQKFQVGASNTILDRFTLRLQSGAAGLAGAPVAVYLIPVAAGNTSPAAASSPASLAIQTDTGNLPGTLNNGDYVTFDLTDTAVTAGAFYGVLVDLTAANPNYSGQWYVQGSNASYNPAEMWDWNERDSNASSGPDWDTIGDDMWFYAQTVPEPSSWLIGGLCTLCLAGYRWRYRKSKA